MTDKFCSQTYLHHAELEFRWLLVKLGYDKWTADLRAFLMKRELAKEVSRLETLVAAANHS